MLIPNSTCSLWRPISSVVPLFAIFVEFFLFFIFLVWYFFFNHPRITTFNIGLISYYKKKTIKLFFARHRNFFLNAQNFTFPTSRGKVSDNTEAYSRSSQYYVSGSLLTCEWHRVRLVDLKRDFYE